MRPILIINNTKISFEHLGYVIDKYKEDAKRFTIRVNDVHPMDFTYPEKRRNIKLNIPHKLVVTYKENYDEYVFTELKYIPKAMKPKRNYENPVLQYTKKGKFVKEYPSIIEAAKAFGRQEGSTISKCLRGVIPSAYGYVWKYKNDPKKEYKEKVEEFERMVKEDEKERTNQTVHGGIGEDLGR